MTPFVASTAQTYTIAAWGAGGGASGGGGGFVEGDVLGDRPSATAYVVVGGSGSIPVRHLPGRRGQRRRRLRPAGRRVLRRVRRERPARATRSSSRAAAAAALSIPHGAACPSTRFGGGGGSMSDRALRAERRRPRTLGGNGASSHARRHLAVQTLSSAGLALSRRLRGGRRPTPGGGGGGGYFGGGGGGLARWWRRRTPASFPPVGTSMPGVDVPCGQHERCSPPERGSERTRRLCSGTGAVLVTPK